jgi:hypothetical protein
MTTCPRDQSVDRPLAGNLSMRQPIRSGAWGALEMAFVPREFWTSHLGKLMACNAADGTEHGLCGPTIASQAFKNAVTGYEAVPSARKTPEVFEKMLIQACWGPDAPKPPARPVTPPYSSASTETCDGFADSLSSVVTASTLCRLLSLDDRQRFALEYGIDIPGSYTSSSDTRWMEELALLAPEDKWFRMKVDEGHGRPLVWFTRREEMTRLLRSALPPGSTLADVVRDHLGLVHHGPLVPHTVLPNHLFVLHVPSAVALRAGHWRPSVMDGIDNRRFMVHGGAVGAPWGTTVYLASFAAGRAEGCSERVLLRLQRELFSNETLTFDYVGRVSNARGTATGVDDDGVFSDFILRGRNIAVLVAAIDP